MFVDILLALIGSIIWICSDMHLLPKLTKKGQPRMALSHESFRRRVLCAGADSELADSDSTPLGSGSLRSRADAEVELT